jgi:hypothetical protein
MRKTKLLSGLMAAAISVTTVAMMTATALPVGAVPSANDPDVVADWVFANNAKAMSGDINGSDFTIKDISGNGNDLKVQNWENVSADNEYLRWDTSTYEGGSSLYFNGLSRFNSAKYFKTVDGAPINEEEFMGENGYTIEAVVRVPHNVSETNPDGFDPDYNKWMSIIMREGAGIELNKSSYEENGDYGILTALNISGNLHFQYVNWTEADTASPFTAWGRNDMEVGFGNNVWHHVAIVSDTNTLHVFVDGAEYTQENLPATGIQGIAKVPNMGYGWLVGIASWKESADEGKLEHPFIGNLQQLKITNRALGQDEFINLTEDPLAEPDIVLDPYKDGLDIGTKVSDLAASYEEDGLTAEVYASDGETLAAADADVATGMVVKVSKDGTQVGRQQVIIYGDADGDGAITALDMQAIKRHLLNKQKLTGANGKAVLLTGDEVSVMDMQAIKRHILKKESISQVR